MLQTGRIPLWIVATVAGTGVTGGRWSIFLRRLCRRWFFNVMVCA
jgi:hypothetical protein